MFPPVFRPLAPDPRIEGHVDTQSLDERNALVWIEGDLVGEAIAEGPDHEVLGARVLEVVGLWVLRQLTEAVSRRDSDALAAVMQRAVPVFIKRSDPGSR